MPSSYGSLYADFDEPGVVPRRIFPDTHPLGQPAEVEAFLDQGERWVSAGGPMDIEAMTPEHALNAANMILDNALRIAVVREAACMGGAERPLDPSIHFEQAVSLKAARAALVGTPLVTALMERAATALPVKPYWAK